MYQVNAAKRIGVAAAAVIVGALVIAAIGFGTAPNKVSAASDKLSTVNMGKPNCPIGPSSDPTCLVIYKITGFQTRAKGTKNPFKVKRDGKIVSWGINIGKPTKKQRKAGGELYGTPALGAHPAVRIVVLKKIKNKKHRYKLVRQGPITKLNGLYGSKPLFTLSDPLRVRKGHVIGISVLTWSPNMISYRGAKNSGWRASASGKDNNCAKAGTSGYKAGPQRSVGSERKYGCKFGDLLLYSAQVVRDPPTASAISEREPVIVDTFSSE